MDGQISMNEFAQQESLDVFSSSNKNITEINAFEIIRPALLAVLDANNIDGKLLSLSLNKNYSSIKLSSFLVCRLCMRNGLSYFSVSANYRAVLPATAVVGEGSKDKAFVNVQLSTATEISKYTVLILNILQSIITQIPKEFDCCSTYMECSDAKKCVTHNKEMALGCGYKRILNSGRIFYGKNRNID